MTSFSSKARYSLRTPQRGSIVATRCGSRIRGFGESLVLALVRRAQWSAAANAWEGGVPRGMFAASAMDWGFP